MTSTLSFSDCIKIFEDMKPEDTFDKVTDMVLENHGVTPEYERMLKFAEENRVAEEMDSIVRKIFCE